MGDWDEWSECTPRAASPTGHQPTSFSLPETYMADRGRAMMSIAREAKESHFAATEHCLASGECPELAMRPSTGAAKCTNGRYLQNSELSLKIPPKILIHDILVMVQKTEETFHYSNCNYHHQQ